MSTLYNYVHYTSQENSPCGKPTASSVIHPPRVHATTLEQFSDTGQRTVFWVNPPPFH